MRKGGGSAPCLPPVLCGADVPGEERWLRSSAPGGAPAQMNAGKSMDPRAFTDHIWAHLQVCSRSRIFCRFGGLLFCFQANFFHLSASQPLKQSWRKQARTLHPFVTW